MTLTDSLLILCAVLLLVLNISLFSIAMDARDILRVLRQIDLDLIKGRKP